MVVTVKKKFINDAKRGRKKVSALEEKNERIEEVVKKSSQDCTTIGTLQFSTDFGR